MAVPVHEQQRASKRRKLSPALEDHEDGHKVSKKRVKPASKAVTDNGNRTNMVKSNGSVDSHVTENLPPLKDLASSEPPLRRAAMKNITKHLESRSPSNPLSPTECLQNLLRGIAQTFAIVSTKDDEAQKAESGVSDGSEPEPGQRNWLTTYHTAFHETMVREWAGIDSHRLNKALLTYRFVMRELFQICFRPIFTASSEPGPDKPTSSTPPKRTKKNSQVAAKASDSVAENTSKDKALSHTTSIVHVLETTGPLNPSDRKIPDGLRLHVLDIWNDELYGALDSLSERSGSANENDKSAATSESSGTQAVLEALKQPLERMAKSDSGAQRHVRMRAKETLQAFNGRQEGGMDA
ncbi:hypothetical protein LTR70_005575 [Exophiala xenobiotica]|nr:hypothetical protein LTR70_005575 [Exophiala xenobiotica]